MIDTRCTVFCATRESEKSAHAFAARIRENGFGSEVKWDETLRVFKIFRTFHKLKTAAPASGGAQ
jgi:hypothetical protein